MKISKIIATDENGKDIIFSIKDGAGIFVTDDNQNLTLQTDNEYINMAIVRSIIQKQPMQVKKIEEEKKE